MSIFFNKSNQNAVDNKPMNEDMVFVDKIKIGMSNQG